MGKGAASAAKENAKPPAGFFDGAASATLAAGWPLRNLVNMATADPAPKKAVDEKGNFSGGKLRPYHDRFSDYVAVQFSSLPKIAITVLVWMYTVDFDAAARGWDWSMTGWEMKIVWRDLFLMVAIAGVWDWILYFSPLKDRLTPYKFNKKYPKWSQLSRDIFWTTCATILAAGQEILLMKWWATSKALPSWFLPYDTPFFGNEHTPYFLLWTATMLYWRIFHFYCIHRAMHPWFDRKLGLMDGDIGAFLYRYVHAHHHKSYNPTAFSGFSMTPVESVLYISAALIPLCFRSGCHPWIHLYTKMDLIIGAQIGHDGFDAPGGGSYYHQLHHAHFECNYGDAAGIPMDWLMGTFEDGSSYDSKAKAKAKGSKGAKADD